MEHHRRRLEQARAFLHHRACEPVSLATLANLACLSPYHFHRLYREAFGETPLETLTRRRMEIAKGLILEGKPITEVCFEVGYASPGTFTTRFSRLVGCPPSTFRTTSVRIFAVKPFWAPRLVPACMLRSWI